jgi:hypothetical protein
MAEIINGVPVATGHIVADNQTIPDTGIQDDSVHDYFHKSIGQLVEKTITLDADATTASENIFQLTGAVEIVSLHGFIVDATTLVNLTAASFDLWDGTIADQITKNDGVLSGLAVGTKFLKNAAKTVTMAVLDNATCVVEEGASLAKVYAPFEIIQKTGVNTYVRFTYTTTDSPIDAQLEIHCRYRPDTYNSTAGTLTAV